jgi:glutamate racemase
VLQSNHQKKTITGGDFLMDKTLPVGMIDSGVGGLTALAQVRRLLPGESIIYIGDSKRMPYGNRTPEEIVAYANKMISFLEERHVKVILLACNTISTNLDRLKSGVRLISVIEAGAEALCAAQKTAKFGMIATYATVRGGMYEKEVARRNPALRLVSNSSRSLPKIIDSQLENIALIEDNIRACIDPILKGHAGIEKILLGCSISPNRKGDQTALSRRRFYRPCRHAGADTQRLPV